MLDLELHGKRALVTGSSAGIGEAIARAFAREGVTVAIHGRNAERANKVAESIKKAGGKAVVVLGDLSRKADADRVAGQTIELLGGVDILVNNAGGADEGFKTWLETDSEQWTETYSQNVLSAVRLIRHLVPGMKKKGWGRVINVSSVVATQPFPMGPDYGAAKAALVNATVSLTKELSGTGVTVNTISPGPIRTAAFERVFRDIAKAQGWGEDWAEIERRAVKEMLQNPTGRVGTSEEVATAALYLASPLAGFTNGQNLRVDGGTAVGIN